MKLCVFLYASLFSYFIQHKTLQIIFNLYFWVMVLNNGVEAIDSF